MSANKHLVQEDDFPYEESNRVELKAHDRLAFSQLTQGEIERKRFQPCSRTICAFLNRNCECDLYLGVKDNGKVIGHPMFTDQKDHFKQNLAKLLSQEFSPPVDDYRYSVHFIPVQTKTPTITGEVPAVRIQSEHVLLKTPNQCYCEKAIQKKKESAPHYIIQVHIKSWQKERDSNEFEIWPYYMNEENKCFTRYTGSNQEINHLQVVSNTYNDLRNIASKG